MNDNRLSYMVLVVSALAYWHGIDERPPQLAAATETPIAVGADGLDALHEHINELECRIAALEARQSTAPPAEEETPDDKNSPAADSVETAEPIIAQDDPPQAELPRAILYKPRWHCPACEQWIAAQSRLPVRLEIKTIADSDLPYGNSYPLIKFEAKGQWWWYRPGTRDSRGRSRTIDLFIQTVNGSRQQARQSQRAVRRSLNDLRQWVRQRYRRSNAAPYFVRIDGQPAVGVMASGYEHQVWDHLQDDNHGFQREQVIGLEQWEALALHDAHHREEIASD